MWGTRIHFLFVQKRQEERQEIVGDELRSFCRRVDAVFLNGSGNRVDIGVEHGKERHAVFRRDETVGFIEGLDVVGTVVTRQGDASEDDFAAGVDEGGDDGIEVAARVGDGEAAEAVVAAELNDDNGGMEAENVLQAVDSVFAGVAADAGVDDLVVVAAVVEVGLEVVGVGLAGRDSVACGDAVAEAGNDGSTIRGDGTGAGRGGVCIEGERKRGNEGEKTSHELGNARSFASPVSQLRMTT